MSLSTKEKIVLPIKEEESFFPQTYWEVKGKTVSFQRFENRDIYKYPNL